MRIWAAARELAARTPPERNRYADLLRATSILAVITGHWLAATAFVSDGEIALGHMLQSHPQTRWLTWIFQVMPIFFVVGGYSNAVSLERAGRGNVGYASWLYARLNRLVAPLLVLLITWGVIGLIAHLIGVRPNVTQLASRAALIPTWFLAIYIMVVAFAPIAYASWRRWGFASFWILVAGAVLVDFAFFVSDGMRWLAWTNYLWVWLAVHHLGFVWRDGRQGGPGRLLLISAIAFLTLYLLVSAGPYPVSMVGTPEEGRSNTLPPKVTLLVLGLAQFGLLLALENPMRRALAGVRAWTATVLINSMIMTVYLWHITVMVAVIGLLYLAGGRGLGFAPGGVEWWLTRPLWLVVLLSALTPVALLLSPLERRARRADASVPSALRQVTGAMVLCLGVAAIAMYGVGGERLVAGTELRLDLAAFALVLTGAGVGGLLPRLPRRRARSPHVESDDLLRMGGRQEGEAGGHGVE